MPALPTRFVPVIVPFAGLFRQPTWRHARALLLGAILAPGARTVASVLRVLGLARERRFCCQQSRELGSAQHSVIG